MSGCPLLVSRYGSRCLPSAASWRARTAELWKRKSVYKETVSKRSEGNLAEGTYLEVLSDLTNETLEGELANQELGTLLVLADFTKGNSSGAEAREKAVPTLRQASQSTWGIQYIPMRLDGPGR